MAAETRAPPGEWRYACGSAPACGSEEGDHSSLFPGLAPRATHLSALRASVAASRGRVALRQLDAQTPIGNERAVAAVSGSTNLGGGPRETC